MSSVVVSGRVIARESQQGIANLIVAALVPDGAHVGSAATDGDGAFAIDVALPIGVENIEIALVVTPPDGGDGSKPLLTTTTRRVRAGRETFLLRIADQRGVNVGLAERDIRVDENRYRHQRGASSQRDLTR